MKFSALSEAKLATCDPQLILIAHKAIENSPHDFKVTHGHRSPAIQFDLFKQGRDYVDGKWVVVEPKKIVTSRDGIKIKSKHNFIPSKAFDIAVLVDGKVTWETKYYKEVADHILSIAKQLKEQELITSDLIWGGNFKSNYDGPHFEIY